MSHNFFLEMIGCDPPLACDLELFENRTSEHMHNHQVENKKQCISNFCSLNEPDCERCAIDKALDALELRNSQHLRVISLPAPKIVNPMHRGRR